MTKDERTVAFGYVPDGKVGEGLAQQQKQDNNISLGSVAQAVPKFTKVEDYTTFVAEYALQDGNIVIHFFLPADFKGNAGNYWAVNFPRALDATARSYFMADRPRLQAKYTPELQSWWFKANSYDHVVDIAGFIRGFFDALDAALETRA